MVTNNLQSSQQADVAVDPRFGGAPGYTIVSWATDLLTAMGIKPTATRISMLVTWANHESGGYGTHSTGGLNNPLNTTESSWSAGVWGPAGVAISQGGQQGDISNFATPQIGVTAQAKNLLGSSASFGYGAIVAALKAQDAPTFFSAINSSSFGTHFGANTALQSGTGGSPSASSTDVGNTATLDSNPFFPTTNANGPLKGAIDGIDNWIGNLPVIGGLIKAGQATGTLAGMFIGIFENWRYVVEVLAGLGLIALGVFLIVKDTGAAKQAAPLVVAAAAA